MKDYSLENSSVIVSHPTGNNFFRNIASGLHRAGMLSGVATCLNTTSLLSRVGGNCPAGIRSELSRRAFHEDWNSLITSHPAMEVGRLIAQRLGWSWLYADPSACLSFYQVYENFDRWVACRLKTERAVYAYEDGALATFGRASELGMARIYDLPQAYWQTLRPLLKEENERLPQWAVTMGDMILNQPPDRKVGELELADLVVVPSQFVADSIPAWARSKRVVLSPFGSPPATQARDGTAERRNGGTTVSDLPAFGPLAFQSSGPPASTKRLRVLFAGSMGQRKGLGDLMAAVRSLGRSDVELVAMGSLLTDRAFYERECPGFVYEGPRSHDRVLALMRSCDVFCLPSIVEGRALVMQEAMSQGLPLIITPNTGGADLVCDADQIGAGSLELEAESQKLRASEARSLELKANSSDSRELGANSSKLTAHSYRRSATGFLVPIRSPEKIAEAINWYADHRAETLEMGRAAQAKAATYTWEAYGDRVVAAIRGVIAERR